MARKTFKAVRTKIFGISFFIYIAMLFTSLPIMAANDTHTLVNYTATNIDLYDAVQAIADRTGLEFNSTTSVANIGSSYYISSLKITDATWSEAMETILATQNTETLTPLTYRIVDSQIVLYYQSKYPYTATLAMNFFPKGDGSTIPASGAVTTPVTRDTNKQITATPIAGYHFVKWTGSATITFTDIFSSITNVKIADVTNADGDVVWNADATAIAWFEKDDLTNGLVAYYPFNGNATDESGKGNDGTINGATLVPDRFGNLNRAYSFDGVSNYISCGNDLSLDLSTFSVSYWVKSDHVPGTGFDSYILCKSGNYASCWDNTANPNPGIMFNDGTDWHYSNPTSDFSANKWYHIVATYNQDSLKVYVNGTLKYTTFASEAPLTNTDPLCIGANSTFSGFFGGSIDDIRIYDRALATTEITKLYKLTTAKLTTASSPAAAGSVTPSPNIAVNPGDPVLVTAYPKAGYRFSKWVISGTATMDNDALTSQIGTVDVNASSTITACFIADSTHKLVSLYNPYPVGPTDEIQVQNAVIQCLKQVGMQYDTTNSNINIGTNFSTQIITPDIHNALWSDALFTILNDLGLTYKIESSKVVLYKQSQLTGPTLVMNFTPTGGGLTSPFPGAVTTTVTTGESFNIQALTSPNYHFVNWTCSANATIAAETSASTTAKLSSDSTITANFAHDTAALTIVAANGSTTPAVGTYINRNTATAIPITAMPAENYHFVNWTTSGSATLSNATKASTTVTLTGGDGSAATVTANFAHDTATLTISENGNGTVNPVVGIYVNQNTATPIDISAKPDTGHHLVNWAVIGSATVADPDSVSTTLTLTGANNSKATLNATFAIDNYQVAFVSGGNGTVNGTTPQYVNYGSDCTAVTAESSADYHFVNWTGDGGFVTTSANPLTVTGVPNAMTITANFAHNQGTINTAITGTGSTTIDDGPYDTKTEYNIAAVDTDATNFEFINWTVSGEGAVADAGDATTTVNLTGKDGCSMTATANFFPLANVLSPIVGTPSTVTGMADSDESINVYRVTVPAGVTRMVVNTSSSGENGDSDIYLGKGFIPSLETYTAKSTETGLTDSVEILNPASVDWYIMVYGYAEYSGVDMTVSFFSDVPIAPTLSSASSDKTDRVTLTWDGGTGTTATSYDVYRSRNNSSNMSTKIGDNVGNVSTWDDTGAVLGTPYYYWIRAKNASGDYSAFSNCLVGGLEGTSLPVILKSGVAITKISGDAGTSSKYQITTPASPAQALLEIKASIGTGDCDMTVTDGGGVAIYSVRITSNESVRIEDPPAGETYTITLYANSAYSGLTLMAKYYSATPAAPTGVAASDGIYSDTVLVSWKASAGATSYEVWRAEKTGSSVPKSSDASIWAETSDSSFFDNVKVEEGKIYYYWLKAKNPAGASAFSASNSGYVSSIPGAPASVVASDGTYFDKIRVTWPKVSGATSYLIYRDSSEVMPGTSIAEVAYDSTKATYTYDDMGGADPKPNTGKSKYYYWVVAKNNNGSGDAKMNNGYIKSTGPTGVAASKGTFFEQVKVTWTAVAGATSYNIYRSQDPSAPGSVFGTSKTPSYYDANVEGTEVYYYWVEADYNSDYQSSLSTSSKGYAKTAVTALPAPVMKSASNGAYSYVYLTWGEAPLAVSYNVYRKINTADSWDKINSLVVTDLFFSDNNADPLQKYIYAVTSVNGIESSISATKTGYAAGTSALITSGSTTEDLSGAKNDEQLFRIEVPENCTSLVAKAENVNLGGSCDIYAKLESYPTTSLYTAKGKLIPGTKADKSLTVTNPASGTWYILVYGSGTAGYVADLTVSYHYATDIMLTQVPADDLVVPFTATFKGKLQDESGTGIPGFNIGVRDPVTGLQTWLTTKTDANGFFTYSAKISGEGEYTYDFFLTSIPDDTKTIASWTVRTARSPWETNEFFDFSGYIPATTVPLNIISPNDLAGMQEFITIRRGFNDDPVNSYESLWIKSTLGMASGDTNILAKLDTGLYFLLYGVEGAAVGNGKSVNPGLTASPFLVHVATDKLDTVIGNLKAKGLIDNELADNVTSGGIGVVAVTSVDNPEEVSNGIYDISLNANEQLELLANLAGNSSISVDASGEKKYGTDLITNLVNTILGESREIGVRLISFEKALNTSP